MVDVRGSRAEQLRTIAREVKDLIAAEVAAGNLPPTEVLILHGNIRVRPAPSRIVVEHSSTTQEVLS